MNYARLSPSSRLKFSCSGHSASAHSITGPGIMTRRAGGVPTVYLANWMTKPRCPRKPTAKKGIRHGANCVSLARAVSAIITAFLVSHGEELLLVFYASAKKRIKGDFSLCHWGESPFHPNELCCLRGARLICLWYPSCIVSRLTHICVSSFMISWYKRKLTHTVIFCCYPLPWKPWRNDSALLKSRGTNRLLAKRAKICCALG